MSALPVELPEIGREKIVRVSVEKDGTPRVEPDHVHIDRRKNETVVWRADPGVHFTICFGNETPFVNFHFHSAPHASGKIRDDAFGKDYKYSVEVNGKIVDPKVGVQPPN